MSFGGFFGGGSSSSSSKDSDASTTPSANITSPLPTTTSATLQRIQSAISEQANVANAKVLISNVNTNCFDKCVTAPGSSLSSTEQRCLSACMEKYIDAWNVTSRTYTARLQKESAQFSGLQGGAAAGGKELF